MSNSITVYRTKSGKLSPRKTTYDTSGVNAMCDNESYARRMREARKPTSWGLRSANTGKLTRLVPSRDLARQMRKPTESVVAIWV